MARFKKFLRKAVKLGGKIAKPLLATTPVGRVALRAQTALKSLGGDIKASRLGKIQPLSVRATVEKIAAAGPAKRITLRPARISPSGVAYQTPADMIGGLTRAQLTGITGFGATKRRKKASRMAQKRRTNGRTTPNTPKPLSPSKLKARAKSKAKYAAWKAAGKPGSFFEWAKANR